VKREDEEAEAEAFKGEEGYMEGEETGVSPHSDLQAKVFAVGEVVEARWWKVGQARWWKVLIFVCYICMRETNRKRFQCIYMRRERHEKRQKLHVKCTYSYIYIHFYTYIHKPIIHTYIYIYIYECVCVYVYVCVCVFVYVHMYNCEHVCRRLL
jgi:hypothetical protein